MFDLGLYKDYPRNHLLCTIMGEIGNENKIHEGNKRTVWPSSAGKSLLLAVQELISSANIFIYMIYMLLQHGEICTSSAGRPPATFVRVPLCRRTVIQYYYINNIVATSTVCQ